jgi:hypothetical protein
VSLPRILALDRDRIKHDSAPAMLDTSRGVTTGNEVQMHPDDTTPIPYGFCQCGCGRRTKIATVTRTARGQKRGEPMPFIRQHQLRKSPHDYLVDPVTGCWNWQLAKDRRGYGRRRFNGRSGRPAHRAAYEIANGPIPDGMCVCHRCDNPSCVNPDHLFIGTYADNNHDRDRKGHQVSLVGEASRAAVITSDQAREIRRRCAEGERQASVARDLGVSKTVVWGVVHRKTWRGT